MVDRLLESSGLPRQYIQLHRDITLQSLTVSTQLIDGVITSVPSPLVVAATEGQVLVVDEADKVIYIDIYISVTVYHIHLSTHCILWMIGSHGSSCCTEKYSGR